MLDVLVVGGGVSGLAAARLLRARGASVAVWEAGAEPGGWARSEPWGEGFLEPGAQVLFRAPGSALDRLLRDLDLPVEALPPGRWIGTASSAVPVPSHTRHWLTSPLLSPREKLRVAWGFRPGADPAPGRDLGTATRGRFGPGFETKVLGALTAGLFAAPADRLDGALLPMLVGRSAGSLVRPAGGMGRLVAALSRDLPMARGCRAEAVEALPSGGFRVTGTHGTLEARRVVVALPAPDAASLLCSMAPQAAEALAELPFLSLRFWHSRHEAHPTLASGWGLLCDPAREGGLLGFTCGPGPAGGLQLRASLGGAYPLAPELTSWPGIEARLRRWFPGLAPATEVVETRADAALPLPKPGRADRLAAIATGLPPGLAWVGAGRFGGGIPGIVGGLEATLPGLLP